MMEFRNTDKTFSVLWNNRPLLLQDADHFFLYAGIGEDSIKEQSGFFTVKDYVTERIPLEVLDIEEREDGIAVDFSREIRAEIKVTGDDVEISFYGQNPKVNRLWIRLAADPEERDYGCGEQFSYLNLRGRSFPLWVSEPGVGRDKSTYITYMSDKTAGNGGDYYHTYFPQPTFVSSRDYFFHTFSTAYAEFDFRHKSFHELQFWEIPDKIYIRGSESLVSVLSKMAELLGHQPELPEHVYNGAILGLQGGTDRVNRLLRRTLDHGIPTAALFCQDWCGNYMDPAFGKRLRWDFRWDSELYPGLPEQMKKWRKQGIRFYGYVNPYLVEGGTLYEDAKANNVLVRNRDGGIYLIHSVSIRCGIVDLSSEKGFHWFKETIKREMIQFGLRGWMADFGEYLPADCVLASGEDPKKAHNRYPALWSRCNYEALRETGMEGEIVFFMRSGMTGSQETTVLQWQGDQSVDFSRHDGMPSALCGALSLAMSGYGLSHSDIGGYTSVFGNVRTRELFERWAEMAAFTPVMRTHEGNRPEENFQYYNDEDCMEHFRRMVRVHTALKPYIQELVHENHVYGTGVQRPVFLHYENDPETWNVQDTYLFGRDILVAPVFHEGDTGREVYFPEDTWIGLFDGRRYSRGKISVEAPIGKPAVFYREESSYRALFEKIKEDLKNEKI